MAGIPKCFQYMAVWLVSVLILSVALTAAAGTDALANQVHSVMQSATVSDVQNRDIKKSQLIRIAGQEGDERFFTLLSAIYRELGLDTEFRLVPAERALALVNSAQLDAEVGRILDPEKKYPQLFYTSEPLLEVRLIALRRKGSKITLTSSHDLHQLRVGYLLGMSLPEQFSKQHSLNAIVVPTHLQLAKMLELNRLDIVLMGTAFTHSPVLDIAEPALQLSAQPVYHILNQRYASLAPAFDTVLREMKQDGRYQQLLNNLKPQQ